MSWSISDIEKLKSSGKIKDFTVVGGGAKVGNAPKVDKLEPKGVQFIKEALTTAGIAYETEYYFAKPRLFRFDIAVPAMMLAIEYEGLVATGKKGGHQTKKGFTSNCTKYNLAAAKGWKLYRYTCKNYKDFESDLKEMIK